MISAERILQEKRNFYNPIAGFDLQKLVRILDQYEQGYLGEAAILWQQIEERDDQICPVAGKRKSAVAGRPWDIVTISDLPEESQQEAEAHQAALKYFYNHLQTSHVFYQNQRGGVSTLIRQMMDSVGKGFAVHEIAWNPTPKGLTARFRFVPLQFFENKTGRLRFMQSQYGVDGVEMPETEWLVTAADKVLMKASSICFAFKRFGIHDWNIYNGRHGIPGIHAQTKAAPNTDAWSSVEDAVDSFGKEWATVTDHDTVFNKVDMSASGEIPFPALVDRMDRALAVIWRGSDLSTLSQGQGLGASVQSEESGGILQDDVQFITETLNEQIDKQVIRMVFGDGVEPLAYFQIKLGDAAKDLYPEIAIDRFLLESGAKLSVANALERYGRSQPIPGEEFLVPPMQQAQPGINGQAPGGFDFANEKPEDVSARLKRASLREVGRAISQDFEPLHSRLSEVISSAKDKRDLDEKLTEFRASLPKLLKSIQAGGRTEEAIEKMLATATLNGVAAAATR